MIAIEVSSAAGRPPFGGIGGSIRNRVNALLRLDPSTRYLLCYRLSRWRRGHLFRPQAPNARIRVVQDPLNSILLRGTRLFHSMGIFLPRTPRTTKLLTIHDLNAVRNLHWVRSSWHERRTRKIRKALLHADHVVTYSAFTKDEVCDEFGLPGERVHAVQLGVDSVAFAPPSPESVARTRGVYGDYVISIGLATPRKNYPTLIEALVPLGDLRLVLIGRRSDGAAALDEAIERHGMRGRVVWKTGILHEELVELLGAACACVVPSLYEGFGLTVLEAMASKTPVICSQAASLPEVAGGAALMVDATRADAIEDAIRRVRDDDGLAADLRERGLARARAMNWESSARALLHLYRELL